VQLLAVESIWYTRRITEGYVAVVSHVVSAACLAVGRTANARVSLVPGLVQDLGACATVNCCAFRPQVSVSLVRSKPALSVATSWYTICGIAIKAWILLGTAEVVRSDATQHNADNASAQFGEPTASPLSARRLRHPSTSTAPTCTVEPARGGALRL